MKYYSDQIERAFPRLLAVIVLALLIAAVIGCSSGSAAAAPEQYVLCARIGESVACETVGVPRDTHGR